MVLLVICLILVLLLCAQVLWKCSYWQRHGVNGPRGVPFFGNMSEFFLGRKHYGDVYKNIYDAHPDLSYIGIYRLFNEPAVLVRSQEMIKEVMIRSFQNFQDNVLWIDEKRDPIVYHNPFVAKGEQWKTMRSEILPIFTPNKVKTSFPHIKSICEKLEAHVALQLRNSNNSFEGKNLFSRYTLDVIASAAYGLDGASLTKPNSDFIKMSENIFLPHPWSLFETISLLFSPLLGKLIKYYYMPPDVQSWLQQIIGKVLEKRCSNKKLDAVTSKSSDFIQWLIEARQKSNEAVDEATIVGHCSTFLLEGFETSSSLMAFALYEFAKYPKVQARIQKEIDEVLGRHGGEVCFEAIQEMPYLGAALYETLRIYPPMMALVKHCTKELDLPPQTIGGKTFHVPKGMAFIIPVKAVHYDADLYKQPLQFEPERFIDQNDKSNGVKFLGFGEGPRTCPGMRFALAQTKAGIATLLSKYSVDLCEDKKTFKIATTTFITSTGDGIWIQFKERK